MADELAKFVRKRGAVKRQFTSFEQFLNSIQADINKESDITQKTIIELQDRTEKCKSLLLEFDQIQSEIECMCDESDL